MVCWFFVILVQFSLSQIFYILFYFYFYIWGSQKSTDIYIYIHIYMLTNPNTDASVMTWCLFGTKPLSKQILNYCQLYPLEQTPVKILTKYTKMHLEMLSAKYQPFFSQPKYVHTHVDNKSLPVNDLLCGNRLRHGHIYIVSQSPCTILTAGINCLPLGLCQGLSMASENDGNFHW